MKNTRTLAALLVAIVTATTLGLASKSQSTPPGTIHLHPPEELIKPPILGAAGKAVITDLYRSWWNWETLSKAVTVKRRNRADLTSPWSEQVQTLTASFFVIDVRATTDINTNRIAELCVTGFYRDGSSCVERWEFTYPIVPVPVGGGHVPISQYPLPSVQRTEVLRTQQHLIRCAEPDPDGRFALLLTESAGRELLKLDYSSLSVSSLLTPTSAPELPHMKSIIFRDHATEGRQYHLSVHPRWEVDHTAPNVGTLVLRDADDDGNFDPYVIFTLQDWSSPAYGANKWVHY